MVLLIIVYTCTIKMLWLSRAILVYFYSYVLKAMKDEIGKGESDKNCDIILRFLKVCHISYIMLVLNKYMYLNN